MTWAWFSWVLLRLLAAVIVILALLFAHELYGEYSYNRESRKRGTGIPKLLRSRPFGIPIIYRIRQATLQNRMPEWSYEGVLSRVALTARQQATFEVVILTCDPENLKTVLATSFKDYSLGDRYGALFPLLGNGIFTLSGEGWKHSRAMLRPQFSREQVSQLNSLQRHTDVLLSAMKKSSADGFFDVQVLLHCLTLDTASEFLFGVSTDSLEDSHREVQGPTRKVAFSQFAHSFAECLDVLSARTQVGMFYRFVDSFKFRQHVAICHEFVDYFVAKALEKPVDEKTEDGSYVFIDALAKETRDARTIRDQAFNILLAGRDTTASLLSLVMYFLARDERVFTKLRNAVLDKFGTDVDGLTFESLKRCGYLNHVISEVLRLNPIVPINARTAIRDTILPRGGGPDENEPILVPKGTKIVYSAYAVHRHPQIWGDNSLEFLPERWEDGTTHSWEYLPFNGGPRICLGQQFALTEISFVTVRILQTFSKIHFQGKPGLDTVPLRCRLTASVADGVFVKFDEATD